MKTFKNIALGILVFTVVIIIGACSFYNYQISPVSKSDKIELIEIPSNSSVKNIASILKKNKLIRDEKMFTIYTKIMGKNNLKAGYYEISPNMGVKKIVKLLEEGSKLNPNEIKITFKEGITMRGIADAISKNTNNSYDSVLEKANDKTYINKLKEKYWFITDDVLNDNLKYKLEGYLFPNTYYYNNKDVSVEEIFGKMLDEMNKVLTPLKDEIKNSNYSLHQILTLASMVEKESIDNNEYRKNIASVFYNRLNANWSLGSDVTTYYALDIDNAKKYLEEHGRGSINYNVKSLYNTRLTDGTMNGKLPVGPISTVSEACIDAALHPNNTDNMYFIANLDTMEMIFYKNSSDFEKKKRELDKVNGGL